ncbi:MAG TPA: isochorismatase family protein [Opitutaceae bacterium]|jgi:nicotinamidase-related amidase|nr:isochorismatase family protein [Opitutaceae bacterium]
MSTGDHFIDGALLLCVDLQPVFINAIDDGPRVLRRCQFAVEAAAGIGLRTAFTEQVPQKLGGTAPELLALAGKKPHVFGKKTFSAFDDDGIRDAVRALDVEHVILCGLETSVCLYQTALAAMDHQLQVTLLTDCIGARRPDDAAVCLDALTRLGVHALPAETVFYALLHDTEHQFFKGFTKLVKKYA